MCWKAASASEGLETGFPAKPVAPPPETSAPFISPGDLRGLLEQDGTVLVDLALSPEYRAGHIPGAWFAIRSRFGAALERLPRFKRLVLTSPDGALARFAAAEVEALTGTPPLLLDGGTAAWKRAGLPIECGFTHPASDPDDVYKRPYEGTDNSLVAMQGYIDWELELVAQLERDGTHRFRVI